jgi:hypothetical protein
MLTSYICKICPSEQNKAKTSKITILKVPTVKLLVDKIAYLMAGVAPTVGECGTSDRDELPVIPCGTES